MTWLAVQLLGSALMTAGGILAVRRSRGLGTALVGLMLLLIVVKACVSHFPAGEPRLFPWDWYPFVESWWHLFPAMFIFGTGIVIVRRSVWKRDGLLVGAGYLLLHCGVTAVLIGRPHEQLTGVVNAEGICHQTSGYSCAPASAATLLHRHGVEATEREMADLCVTRSGGTKMSGTSDSGLMRGLRCKLKDRAIPVISAPEYGQIPVPALVAIQIHSGLCHCIVVSAVEPDQVRVIDPLYGRGTIPRGQFERIWCKAAIHVEPGPAASR